jgi:hypothetical protein
VTLIRKSDVGTIMSEPIVAPFDHAVAELIRASQRVVDGFRGSELSFNAIGALERAAKVANGLLSFEIKAIYRF